jgi:hypothetical protein
MNIIMATVNPRDLLISPVPSQSFQFSIPNQLSFTTPSLSPVSEGSTPSFKDNSRKKRTYPLFLECSDCFQDAKNPTHRFVGTITLGAKECEGANLVASAMKRSISASVS